MAFPTGNWPSRPIVLKVPSRNNYNDSKETKKSMENSVSHLSPPTSSLGPFAIPQALETKIVQEIDHLIRAVQAIV